MTTHKIYSIIAPFYDFALGIIQYNKSVDFIISQFPFNANEPIKVLDAGCGQAYILFLY